MSNDNEFSGVAYPTRDDMLRAAFLQWITADGKNDEATVRRFFAECSDAQLAEECAGEWLGGEASIDELEPIVTEARAQHS